jgi:hypothetical protein
MAVLPCFCLRFVFLVTGLIAWQILTSLPASTFILHSVLSLSEPVLISVCCLLCLCSNFSFSCVKSSRQMRFNILGKNVNISGFFLSWLRVCVTWSNGQELETVGVEFWACDEWDFIVYFRCGQSFCWRVMIQNKGWSYKGSFSFTCTDTILTFIQTA